MKRGRPTKYSPKIAKKICLKLAAGESLTSICSPSDMPSAVSVYAWLDKPEHADFLNRYTQARERQAETFIDQCVDIADASERDTIVKTTKNGNEFEAPDHEWITRSRLRVETRLKLAEKLWPKKYLPANRQELTINKPAIPDISDDMSESQMMEIYKNVMG